MLLLRNEMSELLFGICQFSPVNTYFEMGQSGKGRRDIILKLKPPPPLSPNNHHPNEQIHNNSL